MWEVIEKVIRCELLSVFKIAPGGSLARSMKIRLFFFKFKYARVALLAGEPLRLHIERENFTAGRWILWINSKDIIRIDVKKKSVEALFCA